MAIDVRPTLAAPDDDPYLWLEEIDGAQASAWVEAQNARTLQAFGGAGVHAYHANYIVNKGGATAQEILRVAREMKLDPAEIRRRNFIQPAALPYRTYMGDVYDSGVFAQVLEKLKDLCTVCLLLFLASP